MTVAHRVFLSALLLSTASCGTICTMTDPQCGPFGPYSGTRASMQGHATQLDVPFSVVLDTLLLPVSIPAGVRQRHLKAPSQTVLLHTLHVSGGDAPLSQSLIYFEGGYVRLKTAGAPPRWAKLSPSDRQAIESLMASPEFQAALQALPRRFACCDAEEVAISAGQTAADLDSVRNPPSVSLASIDQVPPVLRRFLQLRDNHGRKYFGRRYSRVLRDAA